MTDNSIEAIEAWFRRRGLPHFIEDYSARRDILTRASPFLTLVLLLEVFLLIEPGWPWWANALAVASGADLVRVHDVAEMALVARVADAAVRAGPRGTRARQPVPRAASPAG